MKWFNPTKGFGFVTALDTPRDALLHASVLAKQGQRWLPEGTEVEVIIDEGPKGLVVSELLEFQEPQEPDNADSDADWIEAEVKFFNFSKGYGFAMICGTDGETEDVFFDSRALAQADLDPPRPGEPFLVQPMERPQGRAAKRLKAA
ncbi:MAG: cold shock domain-containing protein [Pseudomonadota bacterium]|nr:cold shock domain-containing protein [Pseudomonadota bacterium]